MGKQVYHVPWSTQTGPGRGSMPSLVVCHSLSICLQIIETQTNGNHVFHSFITSPYIHYVTHLIIINYSQMSKHHNHQTFFFVVVAIWLLNTCSPTTKKDWVNGFVHKTLSFYNRTVKNVGNRVNEIRALRKEIRFKNMPRWQHATGTLALGLCTRDWTTNPLICRQPDLLTEPEPSRIIHNRGFSVYIAYSFFCSFHCYFHNI